MEQEKQNNHIPKPVEIQTENNKACFEHSHIADIRNKLTPLLTICEIVKIENVKTGSSLNMTELAETGLSSIKHICTVLDTMEQSKPVESKGDVWEEAEVKYCNENSLSHLPPQAQRLFDFLKRNYQLK